MVLLRIIPKSWGYSNRYFSFCSTMEVEGKKLRALNSNRPFLNSIKARGAFCFSPLGGFKCQTLEMLLKPFLHPFFVYCCCCCRHHCCFCFPTPKWLLLWPSSTAWGECVCSHVSTVLRFQVTLQIKSLITKGVVWVTYWLIKYRK